MAENNLGPGTGSPSVPAMSGQTGSDYEKMYRDIEKRFGAQGQELGEYRQFFQNIQPVLTKLNDAPELVQAIIDGKVDQQLAEAVMAGRVEVKDAEAVQRAAQQVQNELGATAYAKADPATLEKLIEARVSGLRKELEDKSEMETFERYTQEFINNTPDFEEYASQIDEWLETHDVTDIEIAYYAVKGQTSETNAKRAAEAAAVERAKDVITNAGGGASRVSHTAGGVPLADLLIAGRSNPNLF